MSTKSILEVEVSTAEFQRYKDLFDAYQEQLKKQPALWAAVAKQHKQLGQQFQHTADAVDDEHKKLEDLNKVNTENERKLEKSKSLWSDMAKSSENFAKNLSSASGFLSKWGGLLFGGIIGGAAFGIDRAVHDASSNRQQAMGFGTTNGQLKAFQTDFGRIGDLSGQLQNVNAMETDPNQAIPWYALGLGKMTGDTVTDTERFLDAQRKMAKTMIAHGQLGTLGTYARAIGLQTPVETLRVMGGTGNAEWQEMQRLSATDANRMNVPGAGALQDLGTQFDRNMGAIWSAFQTNLAKAAPELRKLSDSAARAATSFINTGGGLGKPLADLYLKAQTDPLGAYTDAALAPFKTAMGLAKQSWDAYGNLVAPPVADALTNFSKWAVPQVGNITASPQAYKAYLGRLDLVGGLPKGWLEAVNQAEASGSMYPPNSKKGAVGAFQFMPSVSAGSATDPAFNAHDPTQSANAAEYYFVKYMKEFQDDWGKMLAANNWGPGHLADDIKAHGRDWLRFAPPETQDYVRKIEVILQNNTGGSTTVAANQLPH